MIIRVGFDSIHCGIYKSKGNDLTILEVRMAIKQIFACPHGICSCTGRLAYSVQFLPHAVNGAVHVQKLRTQFLLRLNVLLLRFLVLLVIFFFFNIPGSIEDETTTSHRHPINETLRFPLSYKADNWQNSSNLTCNHDLEESFCARC